MIKLDDNLLTELGLQVLPAEDKKALLRHIYETLEMRVGTTLARQMTDGQLDEFEAFINSNDEAGALRWLETNFPNYKDVVAQEFEVLKAEVRQSASQILASANAAAMPAQLQQASPQPQQDYAASQQYQQYQQQPAMPAPQQPVYSQPVAPQPQAPIATQPAMPQQDYAAPQQYQQVQQQPIQQFDPATQQQPMYTPQYPQPAMPQQYQQQPMQQPGAGMPAQQQPAPSQQPFDQNQFGQAA
jgi:hypothetical protein